MLQLLLSDHLKILAENEFPAMELEEFHPLQNLTDAPKPLVTTFLKLCAETLNQNSQLHFVLFL
jgi:hypothetical protein